MRKGNQIIIRRPKKKDLIEICDLFETTINKNFIDEGIEIDVDGMKNEIDLKKEMIKDDLETKGTKRFFLLACLNKKIIGTICYGESNQIIKEISKGEYNNYKEIAAVYVLPEFQGRNVGKILFNAILISLISNKINEFCLDSGYAKAKNYWENILGEPNYIEKDYWGKGYDHMVWGRKIDDINISFSIKE